MEGVYEGLKIAALSLLNIKLTQQQIQAFTWYAKEMLDWNRRYNLTAITEPSQIEIKHFLDSLTCVLGMGFPLRGRAVDVGTGAGFPGLPLKIVFPNLELSLIESIGKKVDFCRHVVKGLALSGVEIVHARVEETARNPEHRASYDWALARAVAPMEVLAEYLLPLLRVGGKAVVQKGETGPAEAHAADAAPWWQADAIDPGGSAASGRIALPGDDREGGANASQVSSPLGHPGQTPSGGIDQAELDLRIFRTRVHPRGLLAAPEAGLCFYWAWGYEHGPLAS